MNGNGMERASEQASKKAQTQRRKQREMHACMHACTHARTHARTNERTNERTNARIHTPTHTLKFKTAPTQKAKTDSHSTAKKKKPSADNRPNQTRKQIATPHTEHEPAH